MPEPSNVAQQPPHPIESGEPGHICNAETGDGTPCRNHGCYRTDHRCDDRCHIHIGATPGKRCLYSKLDRSDLGERIRDLRDDPQVTDLPEKIAVQSAMID